MINNVEMAVLKGGTSVYENSNGIGMSQAKTNIMVGHAVELQKSGLAVAMAASGAVVEGKEYCDERGIAHDMLTSPQLARRGTAGQMEHFKIAGDLYGVEVTQNLATHAEIDDSAEGTTIVKEILSDAYGGALAILNENPTAGNQETEQYDEDEAAKQDNEEDNADANNDWLACHFAIAARAKYVVLLSHDVDGFEINDGEVQERIKVSEIDSFVEAYARGNHKTGTGGIRSKLLAMGRAAMALPDSEIIYGKSNTSPLSMILGNAICTRVVQ